MKQYPPIHRLGPVAIMLLFAACSVQDIELPEPPAGDVVRFRTETLDNFTTRSAGHTNSGTYALRSMGIYAGYTGGAWDGTTAPNNFFDNLSVSRTSDATAWTYANEQLWPGSGQLSFFAYAPHRDHPVYGANKPTLTANTGIPTLQYTIQPDHTNQVDVLVSSPLLNQTKQGNVTIPLRHALTKIAFSARVLDQLPADTQVRVTRIELSGLYGSGSIALNGQNRQWTLAGTTNHQYTLTNATGGGVATVPLSPVYQMLTPVDGHLFLMPQTLAEGIKGTGATVTVTYETQVGTNPPDVKSFDLELSRAIQRFNPGDAYNLLFTISNGVTFIVAPTPWDDTEVKVDLKNRILNISQIEVGVYDGAVTRVHFWSNQPKDSVYVPINGNADAGKNGSEYLFGAKYPVNNYYLNLGGKKGETGSAANNLTTYNLQYGGFDGVVMTSGEGYIDIIHQPAYVNAGATDLNEYRHIWLNASGLTRNIRINSRLKGWEVTKPYIGTFHRWNEKGERIIAWTESNLTDTDTWTAQIEDTNGSGKEVLIDRIASPFYGHPTTPLYTTNAQYMAAGNPEIVQVSNFATSVRGTGKRIYFRVGWASTTANRSVVRYARIQVETSKGAIYNLYLRQGEEADFVMPYSLTTRAYAVKFSPYNLTEAQLKTSAIDQRDIDPDRKNASFTDYPTQAGAFFQWANAVNARRAYSPVSPIANPASWNTTEVSGFWASLKNTYESCPPGYRRPADGPISAVSTNVALGSEIRQSLWNTPKNGQISDLNNSLWGYYADGYFDRRQIVNPLVLEPGDRNLLTAVAHNDNRVAYIGRLFYNPTSRESLFFPAAGARPNNTGDLQSMGYFGDYLTTASSNATSNDRNYLIVSPTEAFISNTKTIHAHAIRCVRDLIFTTELPPFNETGVPTALAFEADARLATPTSVFVGTGFVLKWNSIMAHDFRNYTEVNSSGIEVVRKITAKVTFKGTTDAGDQPISTDAFHTLLGKEGSTVTFHLNHAQLTWSSAGTRFNFEVHAGWTATRYLGASTTPDGVPVTGKSPAPNVISLSAKGRVVFTRTVPIP